MRILPSLSPLLLSLSLLACGEPIGPIEFDLSNGSPGQRTSIEYSWQDFTACGFGCSLNAPLITGSEARIHLDFPSGWGRDTVIAAVEVASGDAGIEMVGFEADISGNYVNKYLDLRGVTPGFANLDLFDEEGNLVDTIGVSVADVAEVALRQDVVEYNIEVGEGTLLWVELIDAQGRGLVGYPPLSWTFTSGAELVNLRPSPVADEDPITSNLVQLEALTTGTFAARVEAPGGAFADIEILIE